jgi:hypothetical protein
MNTFLIFILLFTATFGIDMAVKTRMERLVKTPIRTTVVFWCALIASGLGTLVFAGLS